ncbi:MAG: homocysteine S-methyltransferase family protein [Alphaproteobacteria bacterium]|nr:homocysteine S-methyltransferase family protein [Alphaproteobacteria bacterium]
MVRLDERLKRGDIIIIDGGTGTELEARGVPMNQVAWCGAANYEHADTLRQVHEDYIRAGADVIITNTFSTARHMLEPAGFGDRVVEANRRAVEIARQARGNAADRPVAIAGSISHFIAGGAGGAKSVDPKWLKPETLRATFTEQAEALANAGCDLIALEMMMRPERSLPALDAALATGLPVWIGTSCERRKEDGVMTAFNYGDVLYADLLDALVERAAGRAQAMTVMHSLVQDSGPGLDMVRARWKGPTGAYPESGYFTMPNWQFVDVIKPADLVTAARGWIGRGAQIIGGCCGTGVAHVKALKQGLPARRAA